MGRAAAPSRRHHGVVSTAPGDPPDDPLGSLPVPDDASELAFEAEALRRERLARARHERWSRLLRLDRLQRGALSGPVVAAVLVVVALVGSLVVVLGPRPPGRLAPQPLAAAPVGGEGGVLPDVTLAVGAGRLPARALRPAVLALLPDGCGCPVEAEQAVGQAASVRLPTYLIAVPESLDDVAELRATRRVRPEAVAFDRDASLARAYSADRDGLTLLLVRADGVVVEVVRGFREGQRLELELARLARASGLDA